MSGEAGALLEERPIEARTGEYDEFVVLYESAFPEGERVDPEFLFLGVRTSRCSLVAYYDEGMFCGFTYEIFLDCALYLLLLAVNDSVRSRGYGSRILDQVKIHAEGLPVVLDIEPLCDDAPNAEQRVKRLRFYERNGFADIGYQIAEQGVTYTVLSTDGFSDMETLSDDISRIAPGVADFQIVRAGQ